MREKKRTFILSDESVNSYGYRVLLGGGDTERFQRNPVMLYSHDYGQLPIGTWENVREEEGRLLADACFDAGDAFAAEIERKVDAGVIRCCSIGFNVVDVDDSDVLKVAGQTGPTVTRWELLECSICAIGANRNAMLLTAGKSETGATVRPGSRMTLTMEQGERDKKHKPINSSDMTEQERTQIEQLQNQVTQLTESNRTLTQERDAARQELEQQREAEAEALLNAAVADGRIVEGDKNPWREMLKLTPGNAKTALSKLNPRTSLVQALEHGGGKGEFAGKSWSELDKAGKLSAYKSADPEGFKTLYQETFHTDYKE